MTPPPVDAAPVAAILAGGRARRLGGAAKALLEVHGRAILDRQLDVLRPRFARICAVLAADADERDASPFAARALAIARDASPGRGPLAGLVAALDWAGGAPLFAVACDMPFIEGLAVDLVVATARDRGADIALPRLAGRAEPLFACYSRACSAVAGRELAASRLALHSLPDAARVAGLTVEEIDEPSLRIADPNLRSFFNVNAPTDRI